VIITSSYDYTVTSNNTAAVMVNGQNEGGKDAVDDCVRILIRLLARSIALKQAEALRKGSAP